MEQYNSEAEIALEEIPQCRFCLGTSKPLFILCHCQGPLAYVHQNCVLNSITLKLQKMQNLVIPSCEFCQMPYSAQLKQIKKKLSLQQTKEKIKHIKLRQFFLLLIYFVGLLIAPYIMAFNIVKFFEGNVTNYLLLIFGQICFPVFFMANMRKPYQKIKKIIQQCFVQLVEIYLVPKRIIN